MPKKPILSVEQIPELPGYITIARAAKLYGVTKGTFYYMIYQQAAFKHIYKVSKGAEDQRPLLVMREAEVERVMAARLAGEPVQDQRSRLVREWNIRVKDWGVMSGWKQTRIMPSGSPTKVLVDAYLAAHPQDPRP